MPSMRKGAPKPYLDKKEYTQTSLFVCILNKLISMFHNYVSAIYSATMKACESHGNDVASTCSADTTDISETVFGKFPSMKEKTTACKLLVTLIRCSLDV